MSININVANCSFTIATDNGILNMEIYNYAVGIPKHKQAFIADIGITIYG